MLEPDTTFGEISGGEFKDFIGENIRLDPISLHHLYLEKVAGADRPLLKAKALHGNLLA